MHSNPGELISIRGHTLTVAEGHAFLFGLIGLFVGAPGEISKPIREEPHYALGAFILSYLVGTFYTSYTSD